jgi:hypothetical protein
MTPAELAVYIGIVLGVFGLIGGMIRFVETAARSIAALRRRFRPELLVHFERSPAYMKDDYQDAPNFPAFIARRTIRVGVSGNGTAADGVRLQLLRFTPQGRQGPIFMREAFDAPPYERSRAGGYRYDKDAPPILFDVCSYTIHATHRAEIALHYAVSSEPNGINAGRKYFVELQGFAQTGRSKPTTFLMQVGRAGQLEFEQADWPAN